MSFFLILKVFSMWCSVQRGSVPLSRRWVAVSHHRRQISPWFAWFTTQRWEIAAVDEEEEVPSLCSMFGNYCTFHSGFSTKKMFHGGSAQIQRIQVGCFICNQLHHKGVNLIWWSSLLDGEQVRRSHKQIGWKKLVLGDIQNSSYLDYGMVLIKLMRSNICTEMFIRVRHWVLQVPSFSSL